jgi:outer membrane protein assembly factor BamB
LIYIIGNKGEISCINAATGEPIYRRNLTGAGAIRATPWAYHDKIWGFDEKGVTRVIKAGEKFELLSQNKLNDKFWASVAATTDAYVFRGVENLYCVKK